MRTHGMSVRLARRDPLSVIVTWDDACDREKTFEWDGSFELAASIADSVPLYKDRQTAGFLVFINEEAVWLAHDYDRNEKEISKLCVIPLGWVTAIHAGRRTLYKRK